MRSHAIDRRQWLATAAAATAASVVQPLRVTAADEPLPRFPIAACDWSIGRRGQIEALDVARQIGLDGVQVSFGPPGDGNDLRSPQVRQAYADAAAEHGVHVASLAMGVLNSVPYASDERAERWVAECVDVMPQLKQRVVLLAFFGQGDINGKPDAQQEVIRRLKRIAPAAEQAGVVLGIESWFSAEDHVRIIDAVGSSAVQVYYDVANSQKMGYDIYRELRWLGRERICEVHCKENGFLLGAGRVDFVKVRQALDAIDWQGWLVIEGATVAGKSLVECYQHNRRHLREVFGG